MQSTRAKQGAKRTQIYMVIVALAIIAASGYLYYYMKHQGTIHQAQNQHTFAQYVANHHLGQLALIDTGTGVDPMTDVLNLNQSVPDAQRQAFALNLAHIYAKYDHGSSLIIMSMKDSTTHKQSVIAESHWDDDKSQLQLTVTTSSGEIKQLNQHVDW